MTERAFTPADAGKIHAAAKPGEKTAPKCEGCGTAIYLFAGPVCERCTRRRHREAVGR